MKTGIFFSLYLQFNCLLFVGIAMWAGGDAFFMEWNCAIIALLFSYAIGRWEMKKEIPPKSPFLFFTIENSILTIVSVILTPLSIHLFSTSKILFAMVLLMNLAATTRLYSNRNLSAQKI